LQGAASFSAQIALFEPSRILDISLKIYDTRQHHSACASQQQERTLLSVLFS
jgi:hypothetical protein